MSYVHERAASELAERHRLSSRDASVLHWIAKLHRDDVGGCFAGVHTLATKTRLSRTAVVRALASLTQIGVIETSRRGQGQTALRAVVCDPQTARSESP